jgi:hypothetical protein
MLVLNACLMNITDICVGIIVDRDMVTSDPSLSTTITSVLWKHHYKTDYVDPPIDATTQAFINGTFIYNIEMDLTFMTVSRSHFFRLLISMNRGDNKGRCIDCNGVSCGANIISSIN